MQLLQWLHPCCIINPEVEETYQRQIGLDNFVLIVHGVDWSVALYVSVPGQIHMDHHVTVLNHQYQQIWAVPPALCTGDVLDESDFVMNACTC